MFVFHPLKLIIPWGFLSLPLAWSKSVKWNRNWFEDGISSPSLTIFSWGVYLCFILLSNTERFWLQKKSELKSGGQCCTGVGLCSRPRAHIHCLQPYTLSSTSSLWGQGWAPDGLWSPPSRLYLPKTSQTAKKLSQALGGERRVLGGNLSWMVKLEPALSLQWD